jgi:hypothetical protein
MAKAKKRAKATSGAKAKRSARRAPAKTTRKRTASGRELIAPRGDKRYVRRAKGGQFSESDDVSRSLSADRRRKAKTKAKRGQGDRGD